MEKNPFLVQLGGVVNHPLQWKEAPYTRDHGGKLTVMRGHSGEKSLQSVNLGRWMWNHLLQWKEASHIWLLKGGRRHSLWSKIAEHVFSLLEPGNLGEKYEDMHYSVDPASVNIF